jgi:uncharacterized repeat protein (TIGR02543 family)
MFKRISTVLILLACWWLNGVEATHAATIQLPRTGQTSCSDIYRNIIPCPGTWQDGELQAGSVWPNPRFTDNGDQTQTDNMTGLIWTKDANLMKSRDPSFDTDFPFYDGMVTWQHALDYINKLNTENYLGHNDWRLPNRNELESLTNMQLMPDPYADNWLKLAGFINVQAEGWQNGYWSSSTFAYSHNKAWTIALYVGEADYYSKTINQFVWPVRNGQTTDLALPVTGQTTCYNSVGTVMPCTDTGQDGELQKGIVWPSPRFTDNGDQTMTDGLTGLIWSKDAKTPGAAICGPGRVLIWDGSTGVLEYLKCINQNSFQGKTDWRLPNRNELASLLNLEQPVIATWLNAQGFVNVNPSNYWSSSINPINGNSMYVVGMDDGILTISERWNANYSNYVWPVRGGQFFNPVISTTPTSIDFSGVVTNSTSHPQVITIVNNGTENLVVSSLATTGGDSGMFSISPGDGTGGTCGSLTPTIAISSNCTVSVKFAPTSVGANTTTLRIASNDRTTPQKDVTLTGTGVLPSFTISTAVVGGNGAISCTSPITSGGSSTCTVTPVTNYHLATFTDNTVDKLSSVAGNSYTITNVIIDHAIQGTFAINTYSVNFNSNGGSVVNSQSVAYGSTAAAPIAPSKIGYTFVGWYGDAGLTSAFVFTTPITAGITLYAKWTANSYTVSFNSNGGNAVNSQSVAYNSVAIVPVSPSRPGYTFAGWYGAAGLTSVFAFTTAITADTTLYAKWTVNSYTVSFNSNGGSVVSSQNVAYNNTATTPAAPTRTGFNFAGWYSDAGLTSVFAFTTAITADTTLYAKWTVNSYTVTPSIGVGTGSNGAISPATSIPVNYNGTSSFTVTPAGGYTATVTGTCGGTLSGTTFTTNPITANCTVVANFSQITHSVSATAGSNGSVNPANQTVSDGATASITVTPATGYQIATVTGCGGSLSGNIHSTAAITADCTVNASFSIKSYALTFAAGSNGSLTGTASQTVNYAGSASQVIAVPSTGYHFVNWTGTGGFVTITANPLTVNNVTAAQNITANFAIDTYTVTPSAGGNGSLSPATAQTVNSGATTSFTVTSGSGYSIASVTGCGGSLSGSTYTTGAITGACTVSASFSAVPASTPLKGDVNGDGKIDIFDALLTLQYSLNLIPHDAATDTQYLANADIAPLDTVTMKPKGDGKIDIMDALVILQRSVNLLSW